MSKIATRFTRLLERRTATNIFISPAHKRTEGRAPVWGSECTSKAAPLQGGSRKKRHWAERKLWVLVVVMRDCEVRYRFLAQSPFRIYFEEKNLASQACGGAMRTIAPACRHTLAPAGLPEAHAEVLCRRRQRYKHLSVVERPQQCYG
jgi:hypothetical protein